MRAEQRPRSRDRRSYRLPRRKSPQMPVVCDETDSPSRRARCVPPSASLTRWIVVRGSTDSFYFGCCFRMQRRASHGKTASGKLYTQLVATTIFWRIAAVLDRYPRRPIRLLSGARRRVPPCPQSRPRNPSLAMCNKTFASVGCAYVLWFFFGLFGAHVRHAALGLRKARPEVLRMGSQLDSIAASCFAEVLCWKTNLWAGVVVHTGVVWRRVGY